MADARYTIGLDFGTNSVRALLVDARTGEEIATSVWNYEHGDAGILLDPHDPDLARQNPDDYLTGIEKTVTAVMARARERGIEPEQVAGIGVDTTGSTPIPVDADGVPLYRRPKFANHPAAMAWLWKDHTGHAEAARITETAERLRPQYLAKCGGTYSSEWLWSKILQCANTSPEVFDAAYTWVECADWIPGILTGTTHPSVIKRCVCAAGHKAMFNDAWGGYPDAEFLGEVDHRLPRIRATLPDRAYTISDTSGGLTQEWALKLGLREGIPVAVGAFDAHLGAVGCGIAPGVLVRILGTSSCDMMVAPLDTDLPDITGLCGIVPGSILPDSYGLEAGQSAVGDVFNWFVNVVKPYGSAGSHEALTEGAAKLKPGESGLIGLDWHNGNRTVLVDQRLTGMILGVNLHSTPAEVYRSLIESTAFGAKVIMERFEEYGVKVNRVINAGGIAVKNPVAMQIYADILNRTMEVTSSSQTCALGSAMAGAVVAGIHPTFASATKAMTTTEDRAFHPNPTAVAVYERLFRVYKSLHDAFGIPGRTADVSRLMKDLLAIRDEARS